MVTWMDQIVQVCVGGWQGTAASDFRLKSAFGCIREKAVHFEVAAAVARKMQLMAATNYVLRKHK